jgi:hypothetical protein
VSDSLELLQTLPGAMLVLRMALVAAFVVVVAFVAERLGPFLGGMVASLPLYTGPVYILLALERDAAYLTAATIGSLAICGASAVFVLAYCMVARTAGSLASVLTALAAWAALAAIVQATEWTLAEALLFVIPIYAVSVPLAWGFTRGVALRRAERGWLDLPLRAVLCGGLAGLVIALSAYMPPQLTGVLSVVPAIMTSLILVLHPRIGGAATAALLAHSLGGLVGMVVAFSLVNQTMPVLGVWPSLALGLAATVTWNLGIIASRSLALRAQSAARAPVAPDAARASPLPPATPLRSPRPHHASAMPPPPPPASPVRRS